MRISLFISGLLAFGLAGCASSGVTLPQSDLAEAGTIAAAPEASPEATLAGPPRFHGKTGDDVYIYHQVWGDCAMLDHGVGRNYAWGRYRMPLNGVSHQIVEEGIRFTCTDGSDCIEGGILEDTPGRTSEHTVPFQSADFTATYLAQVADLRAACQAAVPAP